MEIWETMSHLICPLCGKSSSIRFFHPFLLDDDIYVQTVRGLGRGKGFEVISRESILEDNQVTQAIGRRVLEILLLLLRQNVLSPREVLLKLDIETGYAEAQTLGNEVEALKARLEEVNENRAQLVDYSKRVEGERDTWKGKAEAFQTQVEKLRRDNKRLQFAVETRTRERNMWRVEAETLKVMIDELKKEEDDDVEVEDYTAGEAITSIIEEIEEKFPFHSWRVDADDYPLEALKERVHLIINEYDSVISDSEFSE